MPHGLLTWVSENGPLLSGGKRQRIGIAHALYKGGGVLIFDEATSALHQDTEDKLFSGRSNCPIASRSCWSHAANHHSTL